MSHSVTYMADVRPYMEVKTIINTFIICETFNKNIYTVNNFINKHDNYSIIYFMF